MAEYFTPAQKLADVGRILAVYDAADYNVEVLEGMLDTLHAVLGAVADIAPESTLVEIDAFLEAAEARVEFADSATDIIPFIETVYQKMDKCLHDIDEAERARGGGDARRAGGHNRRRRRHRRTRVATAGSE